MGACVCTVGEYVMCATIVDVFIWIFIFIHFICASWIWALFADTFINSSDRFYIFFVFVDLSIFLFLLLLGFPSFFPQIKLFNFSIYVRFDCHASKSNFLLGPFISFHFFCHFVSYIFSFASFIETFEREKRKKNIQTCLNVIWHGDDDCVVIFGCMCLLCSCECHEIIVWFYYEGLECWFCAILLPRIYIFHFLWKNGRPWVGVCVSEWRINYAMLSVIIQ